MKESIYKLALSLYENGQWEECLTFIEENILSSSLESTEQNSLVLLLTLILLQKRDFSKLQKLIYQFEILQERKEIIYIVAGDTLRVNSSSFSLKTAEILYSLGLYKQELNQERESMDLYEKSLLKDPFFTPSLNNLALLHERTGNIKEAQRLYKKGLNFQKKDPYLQVNMAILSSIYQLPSEPIDLNNSFRILPSHLLASCISYLFIKDNRHSLAVKVLDNQLTHTQQYPSLWYQRGLILEKQGYFAQSFSSFQKAWQLDFHNKAIFKSLWQLLFKNKKTDEMREVLNLLKEEHPHREDTRFFSALEEIHKGEWDKAELNLRYIINHNSHSEEYHEKSLYLLAVLYDRMGDFSQSSLILIQLREKFPQNTVYELGSVLALLKKGSLEEAESALETWLLISPHHFMGNLLKAKLFQAQKKPQKAQEVIKMLDCKKSQVKQLVEEIEKNILFVSSEKSSLWQLPFPILENSLNQYFIDCKDRHCRFFWSIEEDFFMIPSRPREILINQEMLNFYQKTPMNALEPAVELEKSLEQGEDLILSEEQIEQDENISSVSKEVYTISDLAILLDSIEETPLLSENLRKKIKEKKSVFVPLECFKTLQELKDFWRNSLL